MARQLDMSDAAVARRARKAENDAIKAAGGTVPRGRRPKTDEQKAADKAARLLIAPEQPAHEAEALTPAASPVPVEAPATTDAAPEATKAKAPTPAYAARPIGAGSTPKATPEKPKRKRRGEHKASGPAETTKPDAEKAVEASGAAGPASAPSAPQRDNVAPPIEAEAASPGDASAAPEGGGYLPALAPAPSPRRAPGTKRARAVEADAPVIVRPPTPATPRMTARATVRRVRGLIRLGHPLGAIADKAQLHPDALWLIAFTAPTKLTAATIEGIAAAYAHFAPRPAPDLAGSRGEMTRALIELAASQDWAAFYDNLDASGDRGLLPLTPTAMGDVSRLPDAPATPRTPSAAAEADALATDVADALARLAAVETEFATTRTALEGQVADRDQRIMDADEKLTTADLTIRSLRDQLAAAQEDARGAREDFTGGEAKVTLAEEAATVAHDALTKATEAIAQLEAEAAERENADAPAPAGRSSDEAEDEIARLRQEVALLRLTGSDVILSIGDQAIRGHLVDVDMDGAAAVLVQVDGAAAPAPFLLACWTVVADVAPGEREPQGVEVSEAAPRLSLAA